MESAVVAVPVSGCVTNNPPMYCFYKNYNLLSQHFWRSGIWGKLTWVVRVRCLWWAWNQLSTWTVALWRLDWGSVLTAVHPLWLAVAKAASGLRWPLVWGLELLSTWAFPKGCSGHVHGLPLPGQMISKRKEETEQKTERAGSFITWCWKWHTFASALPGWSHKPTLAQCGRGEDRVWIPEGSVRAPSWRLIFVPQWYSCSVSG